jgi:cytosine/adenosine deaminase-related metal-dependent hydrolase
MHAVQARYVFSIDRPPLRDGVVTVREGRIVAVGANESGQRPRDLGNVALLPGLVNAHTHLEFSSLTQPLGSPGMAFPRWIEQVVAQRRAAAEKATAGGSDLAGKRSAAVAAGLAESRAAGVVALGEIATPGWPREAFASDFCGTVFLELLGLAAERVEPLMALAREHVGGAGENRSLTFGLSPHAPYTVHPDLLAQACRLSTEAKIPVAMHLAESIEEIELLQSHSGDMVEVLQNLGAWLPGSLPRGRRPLDYLETLATAHRSLVIHGNFLLDDEIEFLATQRERMTVVYCPRTHAYFPHGKYPLAEMLAAGVRVALGTDSRASNPDLSILAEMRFVAQHQRSIAPAEILKLGTIHGAEALGLSHDFGTLAPGKRADFAIVPLPEATGEPHELLLQ